MALLQTNTGPAAATPAPVVRVPQQRLPVKPSLDKAELQRRVVAFQKQRALAGSPSAQYELGIRYLKGDGVERDLITARHWLTQAAQSGSTEARKRLEEMGTRPKQTSSNSTRALEP